EKTTIGFGLLAEAYANFGYLGILALALLVGGFCGVVTRWSRHVPIASFRGLFALLVLGLSIKTEHTLRVTLASLFQATWWLAASSVCMMTPQRVWERPRGEPAPEPPAAPTLQAVS